MARKTSYQSYFDYYTKAAQKQLMHTQILSEEEFYTKKAEVSQALKAEAFATGESYSKLSRNLSRQIAFAQKEYQSKEQHDVFKKSVDSALAMLESGEYTFSESQKIEIRKKLEEYRQKIKHKAVKRKEYTNFLKNIFPSTKVTSIIQSPNENPVNNDF